MYTAPQKRFRRCGLTLLLADLMENAQRADPIGRELQDVEAEALGGFDRALIVGGDRLPAMRDDRLARHLADDVRCRWLPF